MSEAKWEDVESAFDNSRGSITRAMNTATGVRVQTLHVAEGVICSDSDFIPGEHWDPETKAFLPVGEVVNNSNLDLLLAGLAAIMEDAR